MQKDPLGYYALLGVAPEATADEVKAAFRAKARRLHPDVPVTGNTEIFRRLSEAYHVLSDPGRRGRYDRTLIAPELFAPTVAPHGWTAAPPPRAPEPERSRGLRIAMAALGLCAVTAIGVFAWRALAPATPGAAAGVPAPPAEAPAAPPAPAPPLPRLAGNPTAYVMPEGDAAVLWGGVPGERIVRLGVVPPFTPVHAEALVVDGLQAVALADGHLGYMDAARLMSGDRDDAERARCAYLAGIPPGNGEVLARGDPAGSRRLVIVNREPSAAVVTLSAGGTLAVRVYVGPGQRAELSGLPPGPWSARPEFGELWSRGCGHFVADRRDGTALPLVQPGRPLVISPGD